MANDDSELDDALQRWLKANWPALVVGVVIGLLALGGWRYWQYHKGQEAQVASVQYGKLLNHLGAKQIASAIKLADTLQNDYGGTPYASQADLAVAGYQADRGHYAKAAQRLHWVAQHANDKDLRRLARLREARALWGAGKDQQALSLLQTDEKNGPYLGLFQALRGDILSSEKKFEQAREVYEMALQNLPQGAPLRDVVQHKLNDLKVATQSS